MLTAPDLVQLILAAIESTEQDARQATRKDHAWAIDAQPFRWGDEQDTEILAGGKPIVSCNYEYGGYTTASHIVRHDPASVLRRCAADRRIVETCQFWLHENDAGTDPCAADVLRDLADGYGVAPAPPAEPS